MKTFFSLVLFFLSTSAFANLSGVWSGWGQWTFQGTGTPCSTMQLKFTETEDKFRRRGGFFDCGVVGLEVMEGEWVKQDGNILKDGAIVGSYTNSTFHLEENYSDTVKVISDISREANHFDYTETWFDRDNVVIYEITGRFFLKN